LCDIAQRWSASRIHVNTLCDLTIFCRHVKGKPGRDTTRQSAKCANSWSERLLWLKLTSRHQIWLTSAEVYWPHCACNNASLAYAPVRPADGESMVCSPESKVTQG
jgi:hypothetical protein